MRLTKYSWLPLLIAAIGACQEDSSINTSTTGQGGSMTRFAISNNYLYVVNHAQINVFHIQGTTFQNVGEVDVSSGLETIFARGEYLYLGAVDAMYIYSLANPEVPAFVFRYSHVIACDPVVVQGNRAYVTLRNGSFCNRGSNALEIIDISNPTAPQLIGNYPMQSPHGLAVDNNLLFLCEGENGLKVYDISNELQIELAVQIPEIYAYDVIARNGVLTVTGEDGVFQYRYNAGTGILEMLSKIPVSRSEL